MKTVLYFQLSFCNDNNMKFEGRVDTQRRHVGRCGLCRDFVLT